MKLAGNTLVESLASLALIGLLLALGSQLVLPLLGFQSPQHRHRTRQLVQNALVVATPVIPAESWEVEGRFCEREITPLPENAAWLQVTVRCYAGERLLESATQLLPKP